MFRFRLTAPIVLIAAAWLGGCAKSKPPSAAEVGRQVYLSNCATCHNPNPGLSGSQGPAIAGSSRDLIAARLLHASYPPGYKPKRATHAMVAMPYLAPKIDDLAAFLAATGNGPKE